jgi:hypothetical protein
MDRVTRITFEDNGQDFTHWDVHPETGKVLDCQPFQYDFWCDGKRHVDLGCAFPGASLRLADTAHQSAHEAWTGVLRHKVKSVEDVPADWLHLKNAGLPYEESKAGAA